MDKVLIQIPCFNEEKSLPITINAIREKVKNIDYKILVMNDGSTDNTVEVAKKLNVDFIISNRRNLGLAQTFQSGIDFAKNNNFKYLINTDADNQYRAEYIDKLIEKLNSTNADMVIGCRQFDKIEEFSFIKKKLQKFGSFIVSLAAGQKISDAVSGFRIYNEHSISKIKVTSKFSYTIDVLIQSIDHNLVIEQIPIEVNKSIRDSRLFKGILNFILKQSSVIIKTFIIYRPFQFFGLIGLIPFIFSMLIFIRYFILNFMFASNGHVQSLIAGTILFTLSIVVFSLGIIGLLIKDLRRRIR